MYQIKHKVTNQYLQEWIMKSRFGNWGGEPKLFNKRTVDRLVSILGDSIEITYKKRVTK